MTTAGDRRRRGIYPLEAVEDYRVSKISRVDGGTEYERC